MNRNIIIGLIILVLACAAYKFHTHLQSPTASDSVVIQSTETCTSPGTLGCRCGDDSSLCESGNCTNGICQCNSDSEYCPCTYNGNCYSDECCDGLCSPPDYC